MNEQKYKQCVLINIFTCVQCLFLQFLVLKMITLKCLCCPFELKANLVFFSAVRLSSST